MLHEMYFWRFKKGSQSFKLDFRIDAYRIRSFVHSTALPFCDWKT